MTVQAAPSGWQAWILAARPKTLTAGFTPVIVAAAIAYLLSGKIDLAISLSALLTSVAIQAGTNLINDALDFKKGTDNSARLGPMRVTQKGIFSPRQVLLAGALCFAGAAFFALPLILKGGPIILALVIISLVCGYLYTGGPYPLAYVGLGEFFVFLFYGFVSTVTVSYLIMDQMRWEPFLAGAQLGALATVILCLNNLRDVENDRKSGKCTLAVRYGVPFARLELAFLLFLPFALSPLWVAAGAPYGALLPLPTLFIAVNIIRSVWTTEPGAVYNRYFGQAMLLHLSYGLLLVLGLLVSR